MSQASEGVPPPPSEYKRYLTDLAPVLQGLALADLDDEDIDFLASDTGIAREHIVWLVQAGKLARKTLLPAETTQCSKIEARAREAKTDSIPEAVFYGWFRLDLPSELNTLFMTPTDTLLSTLKAAIEQSFVPANLSANLDGISARIEQLKSDHILKSPRLGIMSSLADLLATLPMPLNLDQQRAIAAVGTDLRAEDPQLVERIAALSGFDGSNAVAVARTLRLDALTEGHIPLVRDLQLRLVDEREGTLRPLAALLPDEWLDLAYTHGTPNGQAITPVTYADTLAASVEQQHPTAVLAAHLMDGRRLGQQPALTDVGTFLRDNPTFDIVTANLDALIEEAELGGVAEPKQLVDGLLTLQRIHKLEARWEEAATLMENGLHSAQKLLEVGPGQLTTLLDGQLTPERVAELYARASDFAEKTGLAETEAQA